MVNQIVTLFPDTVILGPIMSRHGSQIYVNAPFRPFPCLRGAGLADDEDDDDLDLERTVERSLEDQPGSIYSPPPVGHINPPASLEASGGATSSLPTHDLLPEALCSLSTELQPNQNSTVQSCDSVLQNAPSITSSDHASSVQGTSERKSKMTVAPKSDLDIAIENCDSRQVQHVLTEARFLLPSVTSCDGVPYLLKAVSQGSLAIVQLLLRAGLEPSVCDSEGRNILHVAFEHGHDHLLDTLYDNVPCEKWNDSDQAGCTPLMYAVSSGQLSLVQRLLDDRSSDVNAVNQVRQTALHIATGLGHREILEALIKSGGTVNRRDDPDILHGDTCLHYAARMDRPGLLQLLLDNGADWTKINKHGENALYLAASLGHSQVVHSLLEANIMDLQNDDSDSEEMSLLHRSDTRGTPLTIAARNNHPSIVRMLLRHSPEQNVVDALSAAASAGATKCVSVLLNGIPRPLAEMHSQNAALVAAHNGHAETLRLLLNWGCLINASYTHFERTLLHEAARQGQVEAAQVLLEYGADLNASDALGRSPLLYALCYEHYDIVKFFLEHPVDVQQRDFVQNSPLLLAVKHGASEIVRMLLRKNCHVNVSDTIGRSPVFIAVEKRMSDIAWLLIQYGADINIPNYTGGKFALEVAVHKLDLHSVIHLMNAGNGDRSPRASLMSLLKCFRMLAFNENHDHIMEVLLNGAQRFKNKNIRHVVWRVLKLNCAEGGKTSVKNTAIYQLLTRPASLKDQCRVIIRNHLDVMLWQKVFGLPLPKFLQKHLLFHDMLS